MEEGMEFGVDVKTVIKADELTSIKKTTFTDACMLWQEIGVLSTDLHYPLDTLEIPTKHFARTKNEEESKPQFLYTK